MMRFSRMGLWLVVAALGCGLACFAGETPAAAEKDAAASADFSQGLLDRDSVLGAAKTVDRERYPNADDVLVDDYIWTHYNADGTYVTWDDWYVKVLTERGRKERAQLSMYFTIPYSLPEDVQVKRIEVIKPGGKTQAVDVAKLSRIQIEPSQMRANIQNPNQKVLTVGIPNVEIGDVVHYITYYRVRHPRVRDVWADMQLFEYTSPIKHYIYEIFGPQDRPLKRVALKDEVKGTVVHATGQKGDLLHYRWEAKDVPRMFREPRMPSLSRVVQRLLVSTAPDWQTISKWYWSISEPHYKSTPAIKAKVAELTQGIAERQKKIKAIFQFVSQKVRYLGITKESTAPGYEPHDVGDTFDSRGGVCRDKAALLVVMLREAGFKAYPVIIHTGDKKDPDVPLPWFNHAISCVQNDDGNYTLMDSTDENTKQLLPGYLNNKSYLVAKPEGDTLRTSPIVPATDNLMRIQTKGRINAEGDLQAESVLYFDGINDNGYRGWFSNIKPNERRRYFEAVVKRVVPGARITAYELEPENMLDTSKALTVRLGFEAKDILITGDRVRMLPVPTFGTRVGYASLVLRGTGLEKREYPLKTDIACGVKESLELVLDPALGTMEAMPSFPPVESETITWKRSLLQKGNTLTGAGDFLLKVVEFSPKEYSALKDTLRAIEYNARKMPILRAVAAAPAPAPLAGAGADAIVLAEDVSYELADAHNWTETRRVKKRILSYAGKKHYSDLRLRYNTAWETVEVKQASVTGPDGSVKEASAAEKNRMDAGWVGGAPRYPASKTLVVSLPGVDVGSVIAYEIVTTHKDKPFFAMRESFRGFEPIVRKTVTLRCPNRVITAILPDTSGTVATSKKTDGQQLVYSWQAEDVKPVKRERRLPPWYSFNPTIAVTAGAWRTYARSVQKAFAAAASGQAQAEAKAKALVQGVDDETGRLKAIRDFVAKNIRGVGPALYEVPLSAVTPADQVLEQGYGNSADRAVLLVAMLRAVRFRPEFVLASWAPMVESLQRPLHKCPDPSWFGDVLVRLRHGKDLVVLNDTDQYAALGATPHDGRPALLANGKVEMLHAPADQQDVHRVNYQIHVDGEGNAVIRRTASLFGNAYAARKRFFAELPPEERKREFQKMVAAVSQAAKAEGELVTKFDVYPGTESFAVRWEKFAVLDGDYLYFRLPESLAGLFRLQSDSRANPLYESQPRRTTITVSIDLPAAFSHVRMLPPAVAWTCPAAGGSVTVKNASPPTAADGEATAAGAQRLTISYSADLRPTVIPAAEYGQLLDIMRQLSHPKSRTVLLAKPR